ncbi:gamma-glutamylcyclotransferase [Dongia rigui]|uniref:glutathione-specific gamma-glutamylcyclotransferase n=1 Tax=Dongia rigui TaxID=940149 RepID=A0ABU5E224_9PROT|nr:gamma-glutamylcyclotransferase [Dongia rigui]MDY0873538.1 gamma-glutamylcyclotransferase [Dongia rigui]
MKKMALTPDLVARCERFVPEPGPREDIVYFTPEEFAAEAARLVAEAGDGPFWIFAYGSLIWNPGFEVAEYRRGTAHGWHRRFSMEMTRWRGTPEQPGLMLALEHGGSCEGLLLKLPEAEKVPELAKALARETDGAADFAYLRWLNVRTADGPCRALTFWAHPKGFHLPEHPSVDATAQMLARACGHVGSCAAYLYNTVSKLAEHGIYDKNLWRLQELVAREIVGGAVDRD